MLAIFYENNMIDSVCEGWHMKSLSFIWGFEKYEMRKSMDGEILLKWAIVRLYLYYYLNTYNSNYIQITDTLNTENTHFEDRILLCVFTENTTLVSEAWYVGCRFSVDFLWESPFM